MADSILGLPTSAKFAAESDRFYSHRRKILHLYPKGGAPLTGILSMLPEEPVNDSIHNWYEKRYLEPGSTLRGTNPLTKAAPSTGDTNDGTVSDGGATAITVTQYMKVNSVRDFKPGQTVLNMADGVIWIVLAVTQGVSAVATNGYLTVKLLRAVTLGTLATYYAAGLQLLVIGSAYGEGQSGAGLQATGFKRPYAVMNTTQIFRDHFTFPGSVLKMGLKYDNSGPYKEKAKDTIIDHMTGLERSILMGQRSTTSAASLDTSQEDLSRRTMSGILEFLALWDAGSTGLTIDGATYAPYSFKAISTVDTDDGKRVLANTAGTVTVDKWNTWAERVGRYHTNKSNEKLVLCGSKSLMALHAMFRKCSDFKVEVGDKVYGLDFTTLITPFGEFHFVSHPLWNINSSMQYWCLILDVWSMRFRPLLDRDTHLLKMRQNPGDDFRKDEYITEGLLEFWAPENHMLIQNITKYVDHE